MSDEARLLMRQDGIASYGIEGGVKDEKLG